MAELKHAETANTGTTRLPREQRVVPRLKSQDLMQQSRELEIDHEGRIYRLRVTQLNKLILTA